MQELSSTSSLIKHIIEKRTICSILTLKKCILERQIQDLARPGRPPLSTRKGSQEGGGGERGWGRTAWRPSQKGMSYRHDYIALFKAADRFLTVHCFLGSSEVQISICQQGIKRVLMVNLHGSALAMLNDDNAFSRELKTLHSRMYRASHVTVTLLLCRSSLYLLPWPPVIQEIYRTQSRQPKRLGVESLS